MLIEPEEYLSKGMKSFESGDLEEAKYCLIRASFLFFAVGELEKCIKAGELAVEAARKLGYDTYEEEYFPRMARLMLQQELLPEDAVRGFYRTTFDRLGWEEKDPDYEYVVMAAKRIAEYMKRMGQDPGKLADLIEEGEFLIEQRKKFDPSRDKILLTYRNLKLGYLAGFFLGKFDVSKLRSLFEGVEGAERMREMEEERAKRGEWTGYVYFEGLRIFITCNEEGGAFSVSGVRDEEQVKRLVEFLEGLIER